MLFTEKSKTSITASDKCLCCKNETENIMHLFWWIHEEIWKAITSLIEKLFTSLQKTKIPLDMWLTIRAGMGTFLGREDYEMPTTTGDCHHALQQAYDDQTTIGWGNFCKGRIADSWGYLMTQTYVTFHRSDITQSRRRFQTTLITGLWTIFNNIWKLRNAMLHNSKDVSSRSNLALNKWVCVYYHHPRFHLSKSAQHLLQRPLTEILMHSLSKKRAWLRVADTRSSIYRNEHNNIMCSVPILEAFFDTLDPPSPYSNHHLISKIHKPNFKSQLVPLLGPILTINAVVSPAYWVFYASDRIVKEPSQHCSGVPWNLGS